jgi:serine/threonine protein kinase
LASHCKKADHILLFNEFKGTPKGYMAPEIHQVKQNQGGAYDALKADVFALGVVLFALVFGNLPFE